MTLPHSALVVSEQALLERLWPGINAAEALSESDAQWLILSSRRATFALPQESFGSLPAQTLTVRLNNASKRDACWVESMETGWLFLLPLGDGSGTLISVGGQPEDQLDCSGPSALEVTDLRRPPSQRFRPIRGSSPSFA